MKLDFKKKVLDLGLYGERFSVQFPTLIQYENYEESLKKENSSAGECLYNFLEMLGLPKEKAKEMQADDLHQLVDVLTGKKKVS